MRCGKCEKKTGYPHFIHIMWIAFKSYPHRWKSEKSARYGRKKFSFSISRSWYPAMAKVGKMAYL